MGRHNANSQSTKWGNLRSFFKREQELGQVWNSDTASQAFESKTIKSNGNGSQIRLVFRNATPIPLILCWISEKSTPHHFYKLKPISKNNNILLDSCPSDKVEHSSFHHAFSISLPNELETTDGDNSEDANVLDPNNIVAAYRPEQSIEQPDNPIHLVTITRRRKFNFFCFGQDDYLWKLTVTELNLKDQPVVDTADKEYIDTELGGWPVCLEPNWHDNDQELQERLKSHLEAICQHLLPPHARKALMDSDTKLYVNRSLQYGPKRFPITGRGMCFHPGKGWLIENGMTPKKEQCIELYKASEYKRDSSLWGCGGVLLHELCHAYHYKCLPDGYDNEEIVQCYKAAMEEGLYNDVEYHSFSERSPKAKAYACTNAMEYFAELSVAYLGGTSPQEEFNKWFPFNRQQLQKHDPRAYELLQRLWSPDATLQQEIDDDDSQEEEESDTSKGKVAVLGDVWDSSTARTAFLSGKLRSKLGGGDPVRLAFRNATQTDLTLCWIKRNGSPSRFYKLGANGGVGFRNRNFVVETDKVENSYVNDAFTISLAMEDGSDSDEEGSEGSSSNRNDDEAKQSAESDSKGENSGSESDWSSSDCRDLVLDPETIVGGYRPLCVSMEESSDNDDEESDDDDESYRFHLVTVTRKRKGPWLPFQKSQRYKYNVSVRESYCDPTPVDSSKKHYEVGTFGGWSVRLEHNWNNGNKALEERLTRDFEATSKFFPKHALKSLKDQNTLFYINKSLEYGPKICPIEGNGMCFHPDSGWLVEHGMHPEKEGCIELYDACEYLTDCDDWGPGGLLLHELSHAYHYKCVKDGEENKEIRECYKQAMKEKLYESVKVHGSEGPTAKAYACTNEMEYFAELSAAYLGRLEPKKEYNKWFPFNRQQLKQHDPRAYKLLERLWSASGNIKAHHSHKTT